MTATATSGSVLPGLFRVLLERRICVQFSSRVGSSFDFWLNAGEVMFQPDAEGHERLLNRVRLNNQKAAGRVLLVSAQSGQMLNLH